MIVETKFDMLKLKLLNAILRFLSRHFDLHYRNDVEFTLLFVTDSEETTRNVMRVLDTLRY